MPTEMPQTIELPEKLFILVVYHEELERDVPLCEGCA